MDGGSSALCVSTKGRLESSIFTGYHVFQLLVKFSDATSHTCRVLDLAGLQSVQLSWRPHRSHMYIQQISVAVIDRTKRAVLYTRGQELSAYILAFKRENGQLLKQIKNLSRHLPALPHLIPSAPVTVHAKRLMLPFRSGTSTVTLIPQNKGRTCAYSPKPADTCKAVIAFFLADSFLIILYRGR